MKIGLFTDSHYSSAELTCEVRYNNKSLEKIDEALRFFTEEKCDLVICLGDLIDKEKEHEKEIANLKKIADIFSKYTLPIRVVMGNHDCFAFTREEFYSILGESCIPQNIYGSQNIIFMDNCYFRSGKTYMPGDTDWEDTFFPHTKELREILSGVSGDVYIFMHQNADASIRKDHRIANDEEVRKIFETYHIDTVFQGHYHEGHTSEQNGIRYITFPAMCERENAFFVVNL